VRGQEYMRAREKADLLLKQNPKDIEATVIKAQSLAGVKDTDAAIEVMKQAIEIDPQRAATYVDLARIQSSAGRGADAEANFKKAVELDPKNVEGRLELGNFYARDRRWREAEEQVRKAVELDPSDAKTRAVLSRLFIAQGRKADAEQVLQETKKALPANADAYRMLADYYITSGEIQKGIAEYASLVQEHPDDLKLRKNYAELLILTNRLDDAEKINNEILKGNAKDIEGLIHKGQILLRRGRASEAAPVLEAALSVESDNAVARYNLGEAYRQLGNTERAEREWRETIRIQPGMAAAHEALAASALRKGDVLGVLESGESLVRMLPTSAVGFTLRGMARTAQKDYAAADADLKKALELAPESPATHSKMAYLRVAQRRWPEAEQEFEQALTRDPNFVEALRGLMVVYGGRRQTARSLPRVLAQVGKAPQNSEIQVMLGGLYMRSKENEESEAAFGRAIEINPQNLDAYFLLAEVQKNQDSNDRALATYERALKAVPSSPRAHIMLGALESKRGNWQRAEQLFRKAIELDPDNPLATNNLAFLLLEHGGNLDFALTLAQDARRKIPEASFTADTLGWAYYKKGNWGLATDLLEEAVKKAPRNSSYLFHLGMTLQKSGNSTRAKSLLNQALKLDPDSPHAEEIRTALEEME